jgi:predicted metal-binding membrane protein
MATCEMSMPGQSGPGAAVSFLWMWVVMMVPMMAPALIPMLHRYRESVQTTGTTRLCWLTVLVAVGYFGVWSVVAILAYPFSVVMGRAVPSAVGVVVLIAGAFQFSAWKTRQLADCRERLCTPLRADAGAAWRHGLRLGFLCSRCCINLMVILLAIGVMDLRAMVGVTAAIALERLAPAGALVARAIGTVVVAAGLLLIVRAGLNMML